MNRGESLRGRIRLKDTFRDAAGSRTVQRVRRAIGKARRLMSLPHALLFVSIAALPFLWGCVAHVHTRFPVYVHARYYHPRPHPKYFCYDCHGYTYFHPYYDYCGHYGFRIRWDRYSSLRSYHRRHYPRVVREVPHYGEYKYKPDYRKAPQYKKPVDYKKWKKSQERTFYSGKKKSSDVKRKSSEGKKSSKKYPQH